MTNIKSNQIKSNQIKSNRYFYIVALSLIACLIFTACNSRPTQVSSFAVIPEDMTNTGPNITPDTTPTPATEVTYTIGVIYPEVKSYLEGQGIYLTNVSTNSSNKDNLDKIWKALVYDAHPGKMYVVKGTGSHTEKSLSFEANGDIKYNDNSTVSPQHRNKIIKKFVKAVVVKLDDASAQSIFQTTGSVDGQYTIGGIYQIEPIVVAANNNNFNEWLRGLGFTPIKYTSQQYELIYLNAGRSSGSEFSGNNYDAGFSYDVRYGIGTSLEGKDVYDVNSLTNLFPHISYGLKTKHSYDARFKRVN